MPCAQLMPAPTNLFCPACLQSQPHLDLGRQLLCQGCCYRRERTYSRESRYAAAEVGRYEFQVAGAVSQSFRDLCTRCAASTRRAGEHLRFVLAMASDSCVQCLPDA